MLNKKAFLIVAILSLSSISSAAIFKTFKNNSELDIELSITNQNRILIDNDQIIKTAFPDGALTYQYDETDGSIYVHPEISEPFTLFLSTKKGRHLSLTVRARESLGKTIAFKEIIQKESKNSKRVAKKEAPFKKGALEMMQYMEQGIKMPGVKVSHVNLGAGHLKNGIRLIKREIWESDQYKGESFEIYNNSKKRIELNPAWFGDNQIKTVKLSTNKLNPKSNGMLYRVREVSHG